MKLFLSTAVAATLVAAALAPLQASAQWVDRYGSTLDYNAARGSPGPGNGPEWQGYPSDHNSVWRNGRYRGNDPDNNIRHQLMRDK
jgi:hypothetical protein